MMDLTKLLLGIYTVLKLSEAKSVVPLWPVLQPIISRSLSQLAILKRNRFRCANVVQVYDKMAAL